MAKRASDQAGDRKHHKHQTQHLALKHLLLQRNALGPLHQHVFASVGEFDGPCCVETRLIATPNPLPDMRHSAPSALALAPASSVRTKNCDDLSLFSEGARR